VPLATAAAPGPVGFEGEPVMEGTVALPDGVARILPDMEADALLPEAVAEADPEDLGISVAVHQCKLHALRGVYRDLVGRWSYMLLPILSSRMQRKRDSCTYQL
jgi:hypothetical protein